MALIISPSWQVHGMKEAWHLPGEETHHEQDTADWQDAAGEPECLCLPAHPGAAQPSRWGEWPGGRSLRCSHSSILLALIVLPKAWCQSADRKAISQLRVICAPFSNWGASTNLQSSLRILLVFLGRLSTLLFFCCYFFFILWVVLPWSSVAIFKELNLKCLDDLVSVPNTWPFALAF